MSTVIITRTHKYIVGEIFSTEKSVGGGKDYKNIFSAAGRIILGWIYRNRNLNGSIWLSTGISKSFCEHGTESPSLQEQQWNKTH